MLSLGKVKPRQRVCVKTLVYLFGKKPSQTIELKGLIYAEEMTPVPIALTLTSRLDGKEVTWDVLTALIEEKYLRDESADAPQTEDDETDE